jgi:hypothetical protein
VSRAEAAVPVPHPAPGGSTEEVHA